MKNFNKRIFFISTTVFVCLLTPCLIAAACEFEGTLETNGIGVILSKLYYFFRFPTHTLFFEQFPDTFYFYYGGLLVNCMFYGLLTERIISFYKAKKKN